MVWRVEKEGAPSYLAGTAHFFPYHFRGSLRRYIARAETVLFEGPLDQGAAAQVAAAGLAGGGTPSLVGLLDPRTLGRIEREIGCAPPSLSSHALSLGLLGLRGEGLDWDHLRGMRPWMAFFQVWSQYLRKNGWTFTMELDALRIATDLGKADEALFREGGRHRLRGGLPLPRDPGLPRRGRVSRAIPRRNLRARTRRWSGQRAGSSPSRFGRARLVRWTGSPHRRRPATAAT